MTRRRPTQLERLERDGIRRIGTPGSGFRYRDARGRSVRGAARARLEARRVPPGWTEVRLHPSPMARVLAMGRDRRGRWQYHYHAHQTARRARARSQRLVRFLRALPDLRRRVARDLARPGLPREKVMACTVRVLSTCFLRPGSEVYAVENRSYGLATLRRRHVEVRGDVVRFDFPGKSGQRQRRELRDRRVARVVRQLLRLGGREVFQYLDDAGTVVDVRRRGINAYLREVTGASFTAKDFRTWAGTLLCASALARTGIEPHATSAARRRTIADAVRETATHLGNTPAICRASYIEPRVIDHFLAGRALGTHFTSVDELVRPGLRCRTMERELLRLLA